jgi:hypothetical protein
MATKELRRKLRERFPVSDVKKRRGPGGKDLDYVAGETVINRLLSATEDEESGYAWQSQIHTLERVSANESAPYLAVVQGALLIGGDMGTGVGAMINPDPDMAVKSANTEALKNAAKNGFGVGIELWDAEYRAQLGQKRKAVEGNEQALKQMVFTLAQARLDTSKPSQAQIAELFGVKAGDLSDPTTLTAILTDEGLL